MAEVSTSPKCMARRKDGKPCNGSPNVSGYCLAHDPERAGAVAEARRAGGRARHGRRIGTTGDGASVNLATLADVLRAAGARRQRCFAVGELNQSGALFGLSGWRVGRRVRIQRTGKARCRVGNSTAGVMTMPPIKRRQTMIEALEAVTLGKLIQTTDAILGELWGAFSDSELLALSSGLGVLPSSRNPWQAAAVARFEAALQSIQTGAR